MKIIQCLPKAHYNSPLRKYEFPSKNDFQIFIFLHRAFVLEAVEVKMNYNEALDQFLLIKL